MKKLLCLLLALTLVFALAACGESGEPAAEQSAAPSSDAGEEEPAETVDFPTSPITMIVPQDPGGDTDLIARQVASIVEQNEGWTITISNQPGGSTSVGLLQLQAANPDGYTILCNATNLSLLKPQDIADIDSSDFAAIAGCNSESCYLIVRGDEDRFTTMEEFVAYAKEHPGELNVGTGQAGGVWALACTAFEQGAGIDLNIVANAGGIAQVGLTLLNGDVDCAIISLGTNTMYVESGEMKLLNNFSAERTEAYPDVPTALECGYDIEITSNRGFLAPKDTPQEILDILEAAFLEAIESQEYQDFLTNMNSGYMCLNAEDYAAMMAEEDVLYTELFASSAA